MTRPRPTPILALTGLAGSGKSTAAAYLAQTYGFARIRFAGPLKAMLRAYLAAAGVAAGEIERMIEGDLKEVAVPELGDRAPRHAMQTLGTEWGRGLLAPDLWTRAWAGAARRELADGAPGIVVEDCRFANEAETVRGLGGLIVRVERPGLAPLAGGHTSEAQAFAADALVVNDGDTFELGCRLDMLLLERFARAA